MEHTKQFIHDAIEGGYTGLKVTPVVVKYFVDRSDKYIKEYLLDPKAWQAVGKVRGWFVGEICDKYNNCTRDDEWRAIWRKFIDHLADGKTIEESLAKISNA